MHELLIFSVCALGAVWARGRLDTVATTAAVLLAWRGVESFGWQGIGWSWQQAGWYGLLTVVMAAALGYFYRDELRFQGWKTPQDLLALGLWGVVQQGVLLSYLALVNPWLAVAIFAVVHWPNRLLATVTLVGGGASVAIAAYFGEPCILAAGLSHALLSWWLRDWLGAEMGVGEGYESVRAASAEGS